MFKALILTLQNNEQRGLIFHLAILVIQFGESKYRRCEKL